MAGFETLREEADFSSVFREEFLCTEQGRVNVAFAKRYIFREVGVMRFPLSRYSLSRSYIDFGFATVI